jgi:hypothetical protein
MTGQPQITVALERARPLIADESRPLRERLMTWWAIATATRDLATRDAWGDDLVRLAVETGLFAALHKKARRSSAIDLSHVLAWAWRNKNPWR